MIKPYLIYTEIQKESVESITNPMYILRGMIVYSSIIKKYALPIAVLTDPNYQDKFVILETLPVEYLSNDDFKPNNI